MKTFIVRNAAILLLWAINPRFFSNADFGDYADHSFQCPALTTCPQVCAATYEDCPAQMRCGETEHLCLDGTCSTFCESGLVSPCTEDCALVACPRIVASYEYCWENFAPWYKFECDTSDTTEGPSNTETEDTLSWTDPAFLFGYLWVAVSTVGVIGWSWFNHVIDPVKNSRKRLLVDGESSGNTMGSNNSGSKRDATETEVCGSSNETHQIGCKRHPVGTLLHIMCLVTFFGWHVILALHPYKMYHEENEDNHNLILKTYTIALHVGFAWSCVLYWPHSIESIFFRRCDLAEASYVAVYHVWPEDNKHATEDRHVWLRRLILDKATRAWKVIMKHIFAGDNVRMDPDKGILQYCEVRTSEDGNRYFVFLFRRYIFDKNKNRFVAGSWSVGKTFVAMAPPGICVLDEIEAAYEMAVLGSPSDRCMRDYLQQELNSSFLTRLANTEGLSKEEVLKRKSVIGPNVIDMKKPVFLSTLREEISKPFYLYQFYILWIWMGIYYWFMACVNWGIVFITACTISYFRFRSKTVLYKLTKVEGKARVFRGQNFESVHHKDLVPGDIVLLSPGIVHCDMVLLTGESLVDESALTGEATPQAKAPIDPTSEETYDPKLHKRFTISAGTSIQDCTDAIALVRNTASYTFKGELLREMLSFRRHKVQHEIDVPIAITFLVMYSAALFTVVMLYSDAETVLSWILAMTTWSNAFPPLLPVSFIIPVGYAFDRLSKKNITCSNSDSILLSGGVNMAFFDKTGTLTEQGLEYESCRSAESWEVGYWSSPMLSMAMASCHALTRSKDGHLIGNPVDRAMFKSSNAKLVEATGATATIELRGGSRIKILRRFDFDHNGMTQSVIALLPDGKQVAFVKGSGEKLAPHCTQESLPASFFTKLELKSRSGSYQIAVGIKEIPSQTKASMLVRDEVERELTFVGMLNFANKLRHNTVEVIKELREAKVQSIMLTGDSLFTGVHIAQSSGIIQDKERVILASLDSEKKVIWMDQDGKAVCRPDPTSMQESVLTMTGETWQTLLHDSAYAKQIAPFVRVMGRCSPYDKVSVVDTFVGLGHKTLMCGDGGNDCGALKAAHVGVAISDSDASIVSPFTSLEKDLSSVLDVLKEGRCSVASTLAAYKFIILYGNISSYCQVIMYFLEASFSDVMWTFVDGVWTVSFSMSLPLSLPALKLSKTRPSASLVSTHTICSIVGMVLINYGFAVMALFTLFNEDWFQCRKWGENPISGSVLVLADNYEISVVFLMVAAQLIGSAIALNFGYEFRRGFFRNYIFVILAAGYAAWLIYVVLSPGPLSCFFRINCTNEDVVRGITGREPYPINNPFNTTLMPESFRYKMLLIMLGNVLSLSVYEYFLVNGVRRFVSLKNLQKESKTNDEAEQPAEQSPPTTSRLTRFLAERDTIATRSDDSPC